MTGDTNIITIMMMMMLLLMMIIIIIIIINTEYVTLIKNKGIFLRNDTVIVSAKVITVLSNWPIWSDISEAFAASVTKVDDGCNFP